MLKNKNVKLSIVFNTQAQKFLPSILILALCNALLDYCNPGEGINLQVYNVNLNNEHFWVAPMLYITALGAVYTVNRLLALTFSGRGSIE